MASACLQTQPCALFSRLRRSVAIGRPSNSFFSSAAFASTNASASAHVALIRSSSGDVLVNAICCLWLLDCGLAQIAKAKLTAVAFGLNPVQDRNAVLWAMQPEAIDHFCIGLRPLSAELFAEPINLIKKVLAHDALFKVLIWPAMRAALSPLAV